MDQGIERAGGDPQAGRGADEARHAQALEERKVVTVLFCDLADFTQQSEGLDPEDVKALLDPYHELVRSQLERFGGTFEKFVGDAVIGVFGAPIAHDDDAVRAVLAGLRIIETIDALNESDPTLGLRVRVGVETGLALVSMMARPQAGESFVRGDVVNTASRLQTVAPVGGVAVGAATYEATRGAFDYEELPPVTLKGKRDPVTLFHARRRSRGGDPTRAYAAPFIGREVERALLRAICTRSTRDSTFQLVTVCGEPGIGKSRLVSDLFRHIDEDPDLLVTWRRGRCLAYGDGITFWALGEIVKAEAGIDATDAPDTVRAKLDNALPPEEDDAARDWLRQCLMPLVGLGVESAADREESFAAWQRFLEHLAVIRPTVLVIEDLHWADAALLAFLDHLMRHAGPVPLTVVATARPELFERDPLFGAGVRNATRIDLAPLDPRETDALIAALLEGARLPDDVRRLVADHAGGIPLFAEEFVRLLLERKLLRQEDGTWRLAEEDVPLPTGISSLIAARLDALPADRKALLADAAVVGETFWSGAVASMSGADREDVEQAFLEISRMELVRRARASTMAGETEYRFWHALVRDVAYGQIPRAVRADRHLAAAAWMERVAADRVEDVSEIVAGHLTEAIELFEAARRQDRAQALVDRAVRYLALAGDRAMALNGSRAEGHYRRALDLAGPARPERPALLARLAEAVHVTGRPVEAATLYEEAITAFEARGESDPKAAADLTIRYAVVLGTLGDSERSLRLLDDTIGELEAEDPSPELARAYAERAYPGWNTSPEDAIAKAGSALELAERLDLPSVRARALDFRGGSRVSLGDPSGLDDMRAALRLSRELGLTRQTYVTYFNLVAHVCYEDPAEALRVADEGLRFVGDRGLAEGEGWLRAFRIQAMWLVGEWPELLRAADGVRAWAREQSHEWIGVTAAYPQALVLAITGRNDEAAVVAREMEEAAGRLGMRALFGLPRLAELRATGQDQDARETAEATVAAFEVDHEGLPEVATELGRVAVALGRQDLLPRIAGLLGGQLALVRHARATIAALAAQAGGADEEALAMFEGALAGWTSFGAPYERGHALLGQGRCLAALGRSSEAGARAREAADAFELVGAKPAARQAAALMGP